MFFFRARHEGLHVCTHVALGSIAAVAAALIEVEVDFPTSE